MKKLILYGFAGALAMLLAQQPADLLAMDSGMMGSGVYGGYEMGTGMMGYGGVQDYYSMGPGMMSPGDQNGSQNHQNKTYLDKKAAERIFENSLNREHNPNLKLGEIKDEGSVFEADVLTKNNSLVDKLIVNKSTGHVRSAY